MYCRDKQLKLLISDNYRKSYSTAELNIAVNMKIG